MAPVKQKPASSRLSAHAPELARVGWLFGLMLAGSMILGMIERVEPSTDAQIVFEVIDACIILMFAAWRYQEIVPLFAIRRPSLDRMLEMMFVAAGFTVVASVYFVLLKHMGVPMLKASAGFRRDGWPVGSMFLFVSVMPGIFEELAFRGVIQESLGKVCGARDAWLIQGALFSILHLSPIIFPSHFLMGLCLGYMRMRSKSVYPGMLLHASWNALCLWQEL